MKRMKVVSTVLMMAMIAIVSFSCKKDIENTIDPIPDPDSKKFSDLVVPENFTWSTAEYLLIDLEFVDANQNPVVTSFEVYSEYPNGIKFMDGASNENGIFNRKYKVASKRTFFVVIIPNQEPSTVTFENTSLNIGNQQTNAYIAKHTIIVNNPSFKSENANTYQYYPAEDVYGTIGFEDLWPNEGDYDFNDVVIDYNAKATFNDDFKVTQIDMLLYLRASGAAYNNGFGMSFKHSWVYEGEPYADIASVTVNGIAIQPEATEYPSYMLIPNIKEKMNFLNTFPEQEFYPSIEFQVQIIFNTPAEDWWEVDLPLNNPFIISDMERGREVHLPWYLPTSLANPSIAGTHDDASDPFAFDPNNFKASNMFGFYTYMTTEGYPWAINVYFDESNNDLFRYPIEIMDMREAYYPAFDGWVTNYDPFDWYLPEYGIDGKIYETIPDPIYPGVE